MMFRPSGITTPPPLGTFTDPAHDVLDMPVDPNEPTYCLCHQVSEREMDKALQVIVIWYFVSSEAFQHLYFLYSAYVPGTNPGDNLTDVISDHLAY